MAIDYFGMLTLYPLETLVEDLENVLRDERIRIEFFYYDYLDISFLEKMFVVMAQKSHSDNRDISSDLKKIFALMAQKSYLIDRYEITLDDVNEAGFELIVDGLEEIYQKENDELKPRKKDAEINFILFLELLDVFNNGDELFVLIKFNQSGWEHFYSPYVLEYLFKIWTPKYSWMDSYDWLLESPPKQVLLNPWKRYRETMVFGPELVNSLGLKDIDWTHEDIFFHKWLTDDVLWLASPDGFRSNIGKDVSLYKPIDSEIDVVDWLKLEEEVSERHARAVKLRLGIS